MTTYQYLLHVRLIIFYLEFWLSVDQDVIKFWLDAGVDGFRIDAVNYLVEDENFPDEAYIDPSKPHNEYGNLKHNYTLDQPLTFEIIKSWRNILDQYTKDHNVDSR